MTLGADWVTDQPSTDWVSDQDSSWPEIRILEIMAHITRHNPLQEKTSSRRKYEYFKGTS